MKVLIFSIALIIFSNLGFSQKIESKKVIDQSFKNIEDYTYRFTGIHTNLILKNWDKDEINIHVEVTTKANTQEEAAKLLNKIKVQIKNLKKTISTDIDFIKHKSFTIKEFEIKCTIKAPAHIKYNLNNKYGEMFISKITGNSTINTEFTNLKIEELNFSESDKLTLNNLTFSYSEVKIDYCNRAFIKNSYGDLNINKAKAIKLKTNFSNINIDMIETLDINTLHSNCKIKNIEILDINAHHCDIKIDYLGNKLNSENHFGDLNIYKVSPSFYKINTKSEYGDVKIRFSPKAVYNLTAKTTYGSIKLPKKANLNKYIDDYGTCEHAKGIIGTENHTPKGSVHIEVNYGDIEL